MTVKFKFIAFILSRQYKKQQALARLLFRYFFV